MIMADNKQNTNPNVPNSGNVPRLRFPEFSGEWVKVSLLEICERVTRKNKNNRSKLPLTISAQYGLVDQITFFNKVVASADMSNYYLLKKGEFAYNKSYSSDYPWGAIKRLDRYDEGALSSLYICFNIRKCTDSDFAVQYFESPKWYREVSNIAGEGARNHGLLNIAVGDFFNTKHYLPSSIDEQKKIAKLLLLLDQRIATQNKIIQQLQSLIKGIVVSITSGKPNTNISKCLVCKSSTLQENQIEKCGDYPVYGANGVCGYTDKADFDSPAILIVKDGSGVGNVRYVNGDYSVIGTQNILTAQNGYCLKYIFYCLKAFNFVPYKTGMAIPHIYFKDYGKAKIYCPDFEKQVKIASQIDLIESKIEIETQLLNKYEEQKKFLLSNMFI